MKYLLTKFYFFLLFIFTFNLSNSQENSNSQNSFKLEINITNSKNKLPLQDVTVIIDQINSGGITDKNGIFSIKLNEGLYNVRFLFLGFSEVSETVILNRDTLLKIELNESKEELSEVILNAINLNDNVESPQMGVFKLASRDLVKIPSGLGEFDVLRGMTLLAGVNNAGDVSNGISVRGGSLDQNLMIYDHAPVFNPTHLFGLSLIHI